MFLLLRVLGSEEPGDALARQLHREMEGHPFFLVEVLRTLRMRLTGESLEKKGD